ncbi:MAG TPA: hypothetical protein VG326_18860 [Tepidisphaeraceae bacterium]|nr:hypothetical protein [Tepidisphaeraceae bacterium]
MSIHMDSSPNATRRPLVFWLTLVIASLVFTLVQIHYSQNYGRLARTPTGDDIGYLVDAFGRMDDVYAHGWRQIVPNYLHNRPHSPFSTYLAMTGYLIFGITDWAPYAMNGLLVFALLWSADYLMRGARTWQRIMVGAFILTLPLTGKMIVEYRPDIAWGLASAMAVILPLRTSFVNSSRRYRFAAGAWFAGALLAKPSIFPLTVASIGLAWMLAAVCDRAAYGKVVTVRRVVASWSVAAIPVLVFAGTHYLLNFRTIARYITETLAGQNSSIWYIPGGWTAQAKYFLVGVGGQFLLGDQLYVIAGVLAVGVAALIANGRADRDRLSRALSLGVVALAAYLVPTCNRVKNVFFGAEFQILVALGAVLVVHMFCARKKASAISCLGDVLLVAMVVFGFLNYRFAAPFEVNDPDSMAATTRVVQSIARIVYDDAPSENRVTVTGAGWVGAEAIHYLVRQRGKKLVVATTCLLDDPAAYDAEYDRSDFVVAAESGVAEFESVLPSYKILDQTLEIIRRRSDFEQVATVRSTSGKRFFLFRASRFGNWENAENLLPEEKSNPRLPYSPIVRWGVFPAVTLDVSAPAPGRYRLFAVARTPMTGQEITVTADGRQVARHPCASPGPSETIDVMLDLTAGSHEIALNFSKFLPPRNGDPRPLAALFKGLHFGPMSAIPATSPSTHRESP